MAYRDDDEAARLREVQLASELQKIDARIAPLEELRGERTLLAEELRRAREVLAEREAKREPIRLESLRVARPCEESWGLMMGDVRVRHCERCDKDVFDLSEMTRGEAEALLGRHGVLPCVRLFRRADGTVKTADCPRSRRRRWLVAASASGTLSATVAAVFLAIAPGPQAASAPARDRAEPGRIGPLLREAVRPPRRDPAVVPPPIPEPGEMLMGEVAAAPMRTLVEETPGRAEGGTDGASR
jgi:hypothetical protein